VVHHDLLRGRLIHGNCCSTGDHMIAGQKLSTPFGPRTTLMPSLKPTLPPQPKEQPPPTIPATERGAKATSQQLGPQNPPSLPGGSGQFSQGATLEQQKLVQAVDEVKLAMAKLRAKCAMMLLGPWLT